MNEVRVYDGEGNLKTVHSPKKLIKRMWNNVYHDTAHPDKLSIKAHLRKPIIKELYKLICCTCSIHFERPRIRKTCSDECERLRKAAYQRERQKLGFVDANRKKKRDARALAMKEGK